jgi:hypothetical protein
MANQHKRSISLPPDLDHAIVAAAIAEGATVSSWLAATASQRLKLEAGRSAIADWEHEHGPLTPEEQSGGLERARLLLGRSTPRPVARRSA